MLRERCSITRAFDLTTQNPRDCESQGRERKSTQYGPPLPPIPVLKRRRGAFSQTTSPPIATSPDTDYCVETPSPVDPTSPDAFSPESPSIETISESPSVEIPVEAFVETRTVETPVEIPAVEPRLRIDSPLTLEPHPISPRRPQQLTPSVSLVPPTFAPISPQSSLAPGSVAISERSLAAQNERRIQEMQSYTSVDTLGHWTKQHILGAILALKVESDDRHRRTQEALENIAQQISQISRALHQVPRSLQPSTDLLMGQVFLKLFLRNGMATAVHYGLFIPRVIHGVLHFGIIVKAIAAAFLNIFKQLKKVDKEHKFTAIQAFLETLGTYQYSTEDGLYAERLCPLDIKKRGRGSGKSDTCAESTSQVASPLCETRVAETRGETRNQRVGFPLVRTLSWESKHSHHALKNSAREFADDVSTWPSVFGEAEPLDPLFNLDYGDAIEPPFTPQTPVSSINLSKPASRALSPHSPHSPYMSPRTPHTPHTPVYVSSNQPASNPRKSTRAASVAPSTPKPRVRKKSSKSTQSLHDRHKLATIYISMSRIVALYRLMDLSVVMGLPNLDFSKHAGSRTKRPVDMRHYVVDTRLDNPRRCTYGFWEKPLPLAALQSYPYRAILASAELKEMGCLSRLSLELFAGKGCHIGLDWTPAREVPIKSLTCMILEDMQERGLIQSAATYPHVLFWSLWPRCAWDMDWLGETAIHALKKKMRNQRFQQDGGLLLDETALLENDTKMEAVRTFVRDILNNFKTGAPPNFEERRSPSDAGITSKKARKA